MAALKDLLIEQNEFYTGLHFAYTGGMHGNGYANNRFLAEEGFEQQLRDFSLELLEQTLAMACVRMDKPILLIGTKSLGADMVQVATDAYNRKYSARIRFAVIDYDKDEGGSKTFFWASVNPSIAHLCTAETQVIWMDDLMNTGSTLERTRNIFEDRCQIVAVATLFDRSGLSAEDLKVPHFAYLDQEVMSRHPADECPHCAANEPMVTNLGHGSTFKTDNPAYPGGFIKV